MRCFKFGIAVGILALAGAAHAADVGKSKSEHGGSSGGGSSGGVSDGRSGAAGEKSTGGDYLDMTQSDLKYGGLIDIRKERAGYPKPWQVGFALEAHGLVIQNDLEGDASNKALLYGYGYASADISERNRISIRLGFYQRFLADSGETGARFDDMIMSYRRWFPLPKKFNLYLSGRIDWGTSFLSQRQGLVAAIRGTIGSDKTFDFGKAGALYYDARLSGTGYAGKSSTSYDGGNSQCTSGNQVPAGTPANSPSNPWGATNGGYQTTTCGGNPLPTGSLSMLLAVEYAFAYHRPLVIGADVFNEYLWYRFNPQGGQPVQQEWGYEFFARYELPRYKDFRVDLTLAYAMGDPTLGYTSTLHDGVEHLYGFWRRSSQVYAVVDARY